MCETGERERRRGTKKARKSLKGGKHWHQKVGQDLFSPGPFIFLHLPLTLRHWWHAPTPLEEEGQQEREDKGEEFGSWQLRASWGGDRLRWSSSPSGHHHHLPVAIQASPPCGPLQPSFPQARAPLCSQCQLSEAGRDQSPPLSLPVLRGCKWSGSKLGRSLVPQPRKDQRERHFEWRVCPTCKGLLVWAPEVPYLHLMSVPGRP